MCFYRFVNSHIVILDGVTHQHHRHWNVPLMWWDTSTKWKTKRRHTTFMFNHVYNELKSPACADVGTIWILLYTQLWNQLPCFAVFGPFPLLVLLHYLHMVSWELRDWCLTIIKRGPLMCTQQRQATDTCSHVYTRCMTHGRFLFNTPTRMPSLTNTHAHTHTSCC